ncbi:MAG: hypothetical protein HQK49_15210 [Oligoflexia bacterium]|nr:hypothetical protein [Oligoflexia bacterium]
MLQKFHEILKITLFILMLFFILPIGDLCAEETDNFLSWGEKISDSSEIINKHFNQIIKHRLDKINRSIMNRSCWRVAMRIAIDTNGWIETNTSKWINKNSEIDRIPRYPTSQHEYLNKSIYREENKSKFLLNSCPTININGIYFGSDKISHFFGMGIVYFMSYSRGLRKGLDKDDIYEKVTNLGLKSEMGLAGLKSSGVLSYADIEANFQGLLFFESLCLGDKPYLDVVDGEWVMTRDLDLRDYVNPYFDETYYNSVYSPKRWTLVKQHLLPFCDKKKNNLEVIERFNRYDKIIKNMELNFSHKYIDRLMLDGDTLSLDERTFNSLCKSTNE